MEYDGFVYDIELEKNHIFYVRRNGKCVWGSNCRCRMIPVTLNDEAVKDKWVAMLKGETYKPKLIVNLPDNFLNYLQENKERILAAKSTPYWYQDNQKEIEKVI